MLCKASLCCQVFAAYVILSEFRSPGIILVGKLLSLSNMKVGCCSKWVLSCFLVYYWDVKLLCLFSGHGSLWAYGHWPQFQYDLWWHGEDRFFGMCLLFCLLLISRLCCASTRDMCGFSLSTVELICWKCLTCKVADTVKSSSWLLSPVLIMAWPRSLTDLLFLHLPRCFLLQCIVNLKPALPLRNQILKRKQSLCWRTSLQKEC